MSPHVLCVLGPFLAAGLFATPSHAQQPVPVNVAERWDAGDFDAVLDGVEATLKRDPRNADARVWLAAVLATEGLPENGAAVGHAAGATSAAEPAARALAQATAKAVRNIDLQIAPADGSTFGIPERAALERGVRAWLALWATSAEPPAPVPSPRLERALRLVGPLPASPAVLAVRWQGTALAVRLAAAARSASIPDLEVVVGPSFAPLQVAASTFAVLTAPLTVQLQPFVTVAFTGVEPDEQVSVAGESLPVVDGRTASITVARRVTVLRRIGKRERSDEIDVAVGKAEQPLPPWPDLARARVRFAGGGDGSPWSAEDTALLQSLCDKDHGAAARAILDAALAPGEGFVALKDFPSGARVLRGKAAVPILRCRGKVGLGLGQGDDDVVVTLDARTLTIRRADGRVDTVPVICRINTADEVAYYRNGGILHHVLRKLLG